jgi:hypothetical protein
MAAPLDNSQAVAVELERVHKALKPLFERSGVTWKLLQQKGDVEIISNRAMRIPLEIGPPGNFRQINLDGGDLGRGGGTAYQFATVSPLGFAAAMETTKLAEIGTNSNQKAIADVVRRDMKNGVKELVWGLDALLQTGTGQVSTMSSGAATTTWTLGGNFKTLLLHRGLRVQAYDTTFTTQRTGVATIQTVNFPAGQVTVDIIPTGLTNTDILVIEGLSGASPTSLFGIPTFQTDATTGTTLGLSRSSFPELWAQSFNANNTLLTPPYVRLALNKLRIKRDDDESMKSLVAHCNVHQTDAYEQNAMLAAVIYKDPTAKQGFDLFFKAENMAGVPIKTNIKADPTRIDFLELDRWGRAVMADIDFYKDPGDAGTVFGVYGSSGGRAASALWYIYTAQQVFSADPGFGAFISNLARPAGYP